MNARAPSGVVLGCVAGVIGLAGCGGAGARQTLGASVFARSCATCHSLIGNESRGRVGGDLRGYRLSRTEMLEFVREMPARRPLTRSEVAAVSDYVLGLEARACSPGRC